MKTKSVLGLFLKIFFDFLYKFFYIILINLLTLIGLLLPILKISKNGLFFFSDFIINLSIEATTSFIKVKSLLRFLFAKTLIFFEFLIFLQKYKRHILVDSMVRKQ